MSQGRRLKVIAPALDSVSLDPTSRGRRPEVEQQAKNELKHSVFRGKLTEHCPGQISMGSP